MFFKNKNKIIVDLSNQIYKLIIKQSRIKPFYTNLNIPDTVDVGAFYCFGDLLVNLCVAMFDSESLE